MKVEHGSVVVDKKDKKTSVTEYTQFTTRYDSETSAIWCWMQPEPRPCLNTTLIDELVQLQHQLTTTYKTQHPDTIWPFRHLILASKIPDIYNLLLYQCFYLQDELQV